MIKFAATGKTGNTIIGFGLSENNLKNMRENDEAIIINLQKDMKLPFQITVFIFTGDTEEKMTQTLTPLINGNTKISESHDKYSNFK